MRTIFISVLVCIACFATADGQKKRKNLFGLDLTDGSLKRLPPNRFPKVPTKISRDARKREVLQKLKKVKNTEDFLKIFKIPYKKVQKTKTLTKTTLSKSGISTSLSSSFTKVEEPEYNLIPLTSSGDETLLKSATTTQEQPVPEELTCTPRPIVHSLPTSSDFECYPACISLDQCGGCCSDKPGFICKPTVVEVKQHQVFKIIYETGVVESISVPLTHHKECECQCKLEQSDCLSTQTLDKDLCYCSCLQSQSVCSADKVWSSVHCGCICKISSQCPSKMEWDADTCSCKCKSQICASGQIQDPSTCFCVNFS